MLSSEPKMTIVHSPTPHTGGGGLKNAKRLFSCKISYLLHYVT